MSRFRGPQLTGAPPLLSLIVRQREGLRVRLTPAQCAMHGLLGRLLPMGMPRDQSLTDRIRDGHAFLVLIARIDLAGC